MIAIDKYFIPVFIQTLEEPVVGFEPTMILLGRQAQLTRLCDTGM
jgi:hypothetical protein